MLVHNNGNILIPSRKRTLKRVRSEFIRRRPDENALMPETPLNSAIVLSKVLPVNSATNVVQVGRKLYIGSDFANFYLRPASFVLETDLTKSRSVTIMVGQNPLVGEVPLEYVIQRLESYGDVSLSKFANKLAIYNDTYSRLINRYLSYAKSKDPKVQQYLQAIKRKSKLFCHEVEKTHSYWKTVNFAGKDGFRNVALGFSEGLLGKIGFSSVESFVEWSRKNGLISLFGSSNPLVEASVEGVFGCAFFEEDPAKDLSRFKSYLVDKNGLKVEGTIHFLSSFEPVEDGFLYTTYILFDEGVPKFALEVTKDRVVEENLEKVDKEKEMMNE